MSGRIFAALIIGFLVFITIRGDLPQWKAVLFRTPASAGAAAGATTSQTPTASNPSTTTVSNAIPAEVSI